MTKQLHAAAAAIANARGMRRGIPEITNVMDMLPDHLRREVIDDADAALKAAAAVASEDVAEQAAPASQAQQIVEDIHAIDRFAAETTELVAFLATGKYTKEEAYNLIVADIDQFVSREELERAQVTIQYFSFKIVCVCLAALAQVYAELNAQADRAKELQSALLESIEENEKLKAEIAHLAAAQAPAAVSTAPNTHPEDGGPESIAFEEPKSA